VGQRTEYEVAHVPVYAEDLGRTAGLLRSRLGDLAREGWTVLWVGQVATAVMVILERPVGGGVKELADEEAEEIVGRLDEMLRTPELAALLHAHDFPDIGPAEDLPPPRR
jgi:hypothetical protein